MFVDVEAFLFDALADTQAVELLDAEKEQDAGRGGPEVDDRDAERLDAEEVPAAAVEEAAVRGQQTGQERAEDTADTVDAGGADRVVDMQLAVDELDGKDQHDAADEADDHRAERRDHVAARGDAHQARQDAVQRQGQGRLAM